MAAAVADFRPTHVATSKIKKSARPERRHAPVIELTRTDDVLAGAVRARADGQLPNMRAIVGFAAETGDANGDVLFHARAKLQRKGCDLLVVNAVGENRAFEVDNNDGWLLAADGNRSRTGARFEDSDGQPYRGRDRGVPAEQRRVTRATRDTPARKGCASPRHAWVQQARSRSGGDIRRDIIRLTKFRKGIEP